MLALAGTWLLLWLVMQPAGNTPFNDDWAYAFAARSIAETGQFRLTGFSAPNLIAQAYWGALFCLPFGFSFTALHASTLAVAGLLAAFKLMRELGAGPLTAAACALTLGCNPLFLQLSATFMTDVPFASLSIVFLWLHLRGTNRHSPVTIAAAFAAALAATFIRQFGLFLPLAFAAALIVRRGVTWPTLAQAILPLALFTGLHILFQHWVIATGRAPRFNEALGSLAHVSLKARLPIVKHFATALIRAAPARKTRFWLASILLAATLVAGLAHAHEFVPSFGNLLRPYGLGADSNAFRPPIPISNRPPF